MSVLDVENLRRHYALTLRHWLERFERHVEPIRAMFDDAFVRTWRLYLASAQAGFRSGDLQLFQVTCGRASDTGAAMDEARALRDRRPMERCDVLVVGGGPAGSTCARRLVRAGVDVAILDKARFPRDKVCTGWITPAVVRALELDLAEYGGGRTLQPFAGFRTGPIDGDLLLTDFQHTISYGIRRCEFDDYLIRRSGARLLLGQPLGALRRDGDEWVANDAHQGAGASSAPAAISVRSRVESTPARRHEDVVVAQEAEYRLDDRDERRPVG